MSAENFDSDAASEDRGEQEYEAQWGELPGWLDELSPDNRQRVVGVAVRVGMRLTDTDWHLLEDQHRPDLPSVRKLRRTGGGSAGKR
jgi:hypothetical protein